MGRKFEGAGRVYLMKLQEERERAERDQLMSKVEQLEEKLLHGVNTFMKNYARFMMCVLIPGSILYLLLAIK